MRRIGFLLKNYYFLVGAFFLVFMLFIDTNDLFTKVQVWRQHQALQAEKQYYERRIERLKRQHQLLLGSKATLERVAREHYHMKRPGEDVYFLEKK